MLNQRIPEHVKRSIFRHTKEETVWKLFFLYTKMTLLEYR